MSQKFVMLFLVSSPQIVSLEIAAKILIGEDHVEDLDKSKFKSKCHDCHGLLDLFLIKYHLQTDIRIDLLRKLIFSNYAFVSSLLPTSHDHAALGKV